MEDINNLLNTCEVPNLFPADEKAILLDLVRAEARNEGKNLEGSPEQVYAYFIEKYTVLILHLKIQNLTVKVNSTSSLHFLPSEMPLETESVCSRLS